MNAQAGRNQSNNIFNTLKSDMPVEDILHLVNLDHSLSFSDLQRVCNQSKFSPYQQESTLTLKGLQ